MKKVRVDIVNSSHHTLMRVANKCGFIVYEGARHSKIKTPESVFITTISRHLKIKKEVVKAIIKRLKEFGAEIETRN